jgi:hypothetical protein
VQWDSRADDSEKKSCSILEYGNEILAIGNNVLRGALANYLTLHRKGWDLDERGGGGE